MADTYMPKSARPYMPRSARPVLEDRPVSAAAAGFGQGVSMGFGDEIEGAQTAGAGGLVAAGKALLDGDLEALSDVPEQALRAYRGFRDARRGSNASLAESNPASYGAGQVGGALAGGLVSGGAGLGGAGLHGAVAMGAAEGAASGLGGSDADLTTADAREYARAFGDTLKGGAMGAAGGAVGYGLAAGVRSVGRRAAGALRGAREEMLEEAGAARAAEDAAARKADVEQQRGLAIDREEAVKMEAQRVEKAERKARQQAREAAKKAMEEARAARQQGRGRAPAQGASGPVEPETKVLRGYPVQAFNEVAERQLKAQTFRQGMEGAPPALRQDWERYIAEFPEALEDPALARRMVVERNLRQRFGPEASRLLRERFTPDGKVLSRQEAAARRAAPEQRALSEGTTTRPLDYGDVAKQGRAAEVARMGGGGSAMGDFSEAPTRMALVETSGPVAGGMPFRTFEFKPRGSDEIFEVVAAEESPGVVLIDSVMPRRASSVQELHGEVANQVGPRAMRELAAEVARAFPGAKRITGLRATGANPGHDVGVRAPEVTQPGAGPRDMTLRYGQDVDLPPMRDVTQPSARAPEALPDLEDVTQPGMAPRAEPVQRFDVLGAPPALREGVGLPRYGAPRATPPPVDEALAMRRAMGAGNQVGGPMTPAPTRNARPAAMEPSNSMRAPEDAPLPPESALTRATSVPAVRRPEPTRLLPRRQPPPEAAPSAPERTRYAPPGLETRMAARPSVEELAAQREARGGQDIRRAFTEGVTGTDAAAFGGIGLALGGLDGGMGAVLASGGRGVAREMLKNPAARARAITYFKLDRLAHFRPEVWSRVGAALTRASQAGPERYAATRHALLLRDPGFRQAEAEVAREVEGLDDEALAERLTAR